MAELDDQRVLIEIRDPPSEDSVIIEDDGRVAYVYLLANGVIVADVWLYNRGAPPDAPEWSNSARMPFAQPIGYTEDGTITPVECREDIVVKWSRGPDGALIGATIMVRGERFAVLTNGSKPGWSKLATCDGPLAKRLDGAPAI